MKIKSVRGWSPLDERCGVCVTTIGRPLCDNVDGKCGRVRVYPERVARLMERIVHATMEPSNFKAFARAVVDLRPKWAREMERQRRKA